MYFHIFKKSVQRGRYSNLILWVLDCIVTFLFGVYLVLWLFELGL